MTDNPPERAWRLLKSHLSPYQRRTLVVTGLFYIRVKSQIIGYSGEYFALHDGHWAFLIVGGKPAGAYGFSPGDYFNYRSSLRGNKTIPRADALLAQMLLLESASADALRIACKWEGAHRLHAWYTGWGRHLRPTTLRALYSGRYFKPELLT